ncbi:hypothetical protein GII33_22220 [Gordonia pseudamarae]|jgi:hypothetical protein|uniref:Uncharacterized protein n=1 Tax=Gordonia pseudamarae TaxID=2831662 RepID=A0ABX6IMH1_9ACTN|nr:MULTISPECIES: hypothetical protein [Gordonia]MBD0024253.1 hypothetical protein [Gordonia sp. (in: high G+C Gram-positive bacteria)]QHN28285.1 hypothetical protein GII33_22220 [Gordonia pseudamarae]QHN37147.1 hypothetical protein GII31_21850 [Gordonia pseudamarae]
MNKKQVVAAAAITAAATANIAIGVGTAVASTDNPTTGDRVTYVFISDVADNGSSNWFTADNDQSSLTTTHLPTYGTYTRSSGTKLYSGTRSFTSRSTYQVTGAAIQTSGYYAECRVLVNGVQVSVDSATGRYAVAVC